MTIAAGSAGLAGQPFAAGLEKPVGIDPEDIEDRKAFETLRLRGFLARLPVGEMEPNDTTGTATPIAAGEIGAGDISPAGDMDYWVKAGHGTGDLVFAFVDTAGSTTSDNSLLEVYADDGSTLIEMDQADGPGDSSCLAGALLPQDGSVFFRVSEVGNDFTITPYKLYQGVFDPALVAVEREGNDSAATAEPILGPVTSAGIPGGDTEDWYKFFAAAGDSLVVIVDDDPDDDGNRFDSEVSIRDTDGTTLLADGDNLASHDGNCAGAVTAPTTGTYFLRVSDEGFGGGDTDYTFTVLVNGTAAGSVRKAEAEPNDTSGTATPIAAGRIGVGEINPVEDVDYWVKAGHGTGDLVFAYVDTAETTTSSDSLLQVYANDGSTLIEEDDDDGPAFSSCIAGAPLPQWGNVFFRVEHDNNSTITPYKLHQGVFAPALVAVEREGNDTAGSAEPILGPVTSGGVPAVDTEDWYQFFAAAGDSLVVIMDDDPDNDANLFDSGIAILDTDGSTVLANGDDQGAHDGNCAGAVTAPTTGTYFLRISDGGGGDGDTDYTFTVLVNGTAAGSVRKPELEPNDIAGGATPIAAGEIGLGEINPFGDMDYWVRAGQDAGDLVFAYVDATDSTSSRDSLLDVYADDGSTLIESDDDDGPFQSSCIAGAPLPQAGNVFFRVSQSLGIAKITPYRLHQGVFAPALVANEREGNDSAATAEPILGPVTSAGVPGVDTEDWYKFFAAAGDSLVVIMDDDPDNDENLFDSEVSILDTDGTTVLADGDDEATRNGNCAGAATAPTTGTYFLRVSDGGNGGGDTDYTFTVLAEGSAMRCLGSLVLANEAVSSAAIYRACDSMSVGPDVTVEGPGGDLTLVAGESVAFENLFSVETGSSLAVFLDPSLVP